MIMSPGKSAVVNVFPSFAWAETIEGALLLPKHSESEEKCDQKYEEMIHFCSLCDRCEFSW